MSVRPLLSRSILRPRINAAAVFVPSFRAAMSSASTTKRDWLIIIPDKPGMHDKRLEVRPAHFEGLQPLVKSDDYKMGGALLNSVPSGSDPSTFDFHGSTIVRAAESKEEIIADLRNDIYAKSGVWDVDNATILPFICAFRKAQ
jgi:uncharacterized protein YciI